MLSKQNNIAVSEHGLRIMAMLYLTPVLPLGPISYMCGSCTGMALSSFVLAKVASLPLMTLYVYMGASAGTLLLDSNNSNNANAAHNPKLLLMGLGLSFCTISGITYYIRKMLMVILEKQKSKISSNPATTINHDTSATTNNNIPLILSLPDHDNDNVDNNDESSSGSTKSVAGGDVEISSPTIMKQPLKQRHVVLGGQSNNSNLLYAPNLNNSNNNEEQPKSSPEKDK